MKSEVMLHDLVKLPQILRRLAAQQLEWAPLAKALLTVSPDERVPTSKRLQQELGLAASRYRRWLDALYAAYLNLLAADSEAICQREAEYQLILTGRRATQVVHCRLPATPRVGEQLELDFLYAVTGDYLFYVESLTHDLSGGAYVVRVHLQHGYYNEYRQQLLQRARFEETLSLQVELSAPGYLLDDFLRERYPHQRSPHGHMSYSKRLKPATAGVPDPGSSGMTSLAASI
jgi:hypothetical protein